METQQKCKRDAILTEKEHEYLNAIFCYRYLTPSLFKRLFNEKSLRTVQYRLQQLWIKGFIRRIRLPHLIGEGSSEIIYALSRAGFNTIKNDLYFSDSEKINKQASTPPKGVSHLKHLLMANNFLVSLEVSARQCSVEIMELDTYYNRPFILEYSNALISNQKFNIIPDAKFVLCRNDKKALFFLEVDRGTEPLRSFINKNRSNISRKVETYNKILEKRDFSKFGKFTGFRVLILTTTFERRNRLETFISELIDNECFWFTTEDEIIEKNILTDAIWIVSGDSNNIRRLLKI